MIDTAALKNLLNILGGNIDSLDDIIGDFLSVAPDLLEQIKTHYENNDCDGIRIAAHTLKSNARDLGGTHLSELCTKLEHQATVRETDHIEQLISDITVSVSETTAALRDVNINGI